MKSGKLTALTILVIFLTSWSAPAHEAQAGNKYFCAGHLAMMQEQLDLTDEQASVMQEILAGGQETIDEIFASHGLERGDLRMMRQEMRKFRRLGTERLGTIMDQEQLQILHQEIFENGPLEFMQLPEDEKLALVQDFLGLNEEEGSQVAAILEEGRVQRENVLESSGFNPEQMMSLRQDMTNHREELKKSLSEILSNEQMEQFEELSSRMQLRNSGYGLSFASQGGQL